MGKHFCTCTSFDCTSHPKNHENGCDPCIKKNLELGEIPACFWANVTEVKGESEYSAENFAKFVIEKQNGR
jgi:hypothetical protein